MLDRSKLLLELYRVENQLLSIDDKPLIELEHWWKIIQSDEQVSQKIRSRKWSLLVPDWQGAMGSLITIEPFAHPYTILAVDGSQIYYDKHQGPACYLVNTGSVLLEYGEQTSRVVLDSQPEVVVASSQDQIDTGVESVNLYREQKELQLAVDKSIKYLAEGAAPFLCMLDGTLIFFQVDVQTHDEKINFFAQYMAQLEQLYQHQVLHVAYMSFPRTKELLNVIRLVAANYQESNVNMTSSWYQLNDMDVAKLFLAPLTRSGVFGSKAPVSYAYPAHLKPYFCYLNVGQEIVRLEFPQWIAQNSLLIDQICGMVISQVEKGRGYPVALFEAHEQAVVKAAEREFFYQILKNMHVKNDLLYQNSCKSFKKSQVPV